MRKIIVKYLALSYRVRLFGKEFTFVRAANVIVPLMLLLGYALIAQVAWLEWFVLVATAIAWLLVIVYLKLYPVKWAELDEEQKWFYGNAALSGKTKAVMTDKQYTQWKSIASIYGSNSIKWSNVKAFIVAPMALLLFVASII